MQEENLSASTIARIGVTLTPYTCNNEIDVSWNNAGNTSSISVDRIVNGALAHERSRVSPTTFWPDTGAFYNFTTYTYNVYNFDSRGNMSANGSGQIYLSSCSTQFSTAFIQDTNHKSSNNEAQLLEVPASELVKIQGGAFEVLVPYESVINHYTHQTSVINSQEDWQLF